MKISLTTILFLPLTFLFIYLVNNGFPVSWFIKTPSTTITYIIMYVCFGILLFTDVFKNKHHHFHQIRLITVVVSIFIIVGTTIFFQISLRHDNNIYNLIHDGSQMTEVAGEMLWEGKNPYSENFQNTSFGVHNNTSKYGFENPAWHHYIYLPFYTIFSAIFQKLCLWVIGWYDLRFIFILLFALSLYILYKLVPDKEEKVFILLFFSFNPIFVFYFITGFNDIFVYFFLILAFYLLLKEKNAWSALVMGLALLSKQTAWLAFPFYILYLLGKNNGNFKAVLKKMWPLYLTFILFALPFIIWSPSNLITDTLLYASGSSQHIFPILGSGFSSFLLEAGIIKDWLDYFPFWIIQLIICLPLLFFLLRDQIKNNTVSRLVFNYTFLLFVYLFFNRFFNPNYLSFISLLLIFVWVISKYEKNQKRKIIK